MSQGFLARLRFPQVQQIILPQDWCGQVSLGPSLHSWVIDAAGIQDRREVGTGCWEGHGCERGGNSKAALVLLNSCSQGTLLAGVPQVSGFSKQQLMSRDPASSKGQVQGCSAGMGSRGATQAPTSKGWSRDEAGGERGELKVKSYTVTVALRWRAGLQGLQGSFGCKVYSAKDRSCEVLSIQHRSEHQS